MAHLRNRQARDSLLAHHDGFALRFAIVAVVVGWCQQRTRSMAGLASPTHRPLHGDKSKPGFKARRFCVLFGRGVGEVERCCHVHNWGLWDALQTKEMRPGRAESGIGLEKGIGLVHGKRCAALLISRSVVAGKPTSLHDHVLRRCVKRESKRLQRGMPTEICLYTYALISVLACCIYAYSPSLSVNTTTSGQRRALSVDFLLT